MLSLSQVFVSFKSQMSNIFLRILSSQWKDSSGIIASSFILQLLIEFLLWADYVCEIRQNTRDTWPWMETEKLTKSYEIMLWEETNSVHPSEMSTRLWGMPVPRCRIRVAIHTWSHWRGLDEPGTESKAEPQGISAVKGHAKEKRPKKRLRGRRST